MSARRFRSLLPWLLIAIAVIALDQIVKTWIVQNYVYGESHRITSFFNLVRAHNTGAAFSFLAGAGGWQRWFFIGLGFVASAVIIWLLLKHNEQRMFAWALTLILGGAIGNVVDRMLHGYVVDFLQVHWGSQYFFPAFNVADMAISLGAGLLILDEILRVRRGK